MGEGLTVEDALQGVSVEVSHLLNVSLLSPPLTLLFACLDQVVEVFDLVQVNLAERPVD